MAFAHFTLPTLDVQGTARLLEQTLGFRRAEAPANSPCETVWLDMGRGQQIHVVYVEGFACSAFEGEFGRHFAVYHPVSAFPALKRLLQEIGAEVYDPLRPSPFARFFFREPINGYVFEVIDAAQQPKIFHHEGHEAHEGPGG
jgi:hypothetical protein